MIDALLTLRRGDEVDGRTTCCGKTRTLVFLRTAEDTEVDPDSDGDPDWMGWFSTLGTGEWSPLIVGIEVHGDEVWAFDHRPDGKIDQHRMVLDF